MRDVCILTSVESGLALLLMVHDSHRGFCVGYKYQTQTHYVSLHKPTMDAKPHVCGVVHNEGASCRIHYHHSTNYHLGLIKFQGLLLEPRICQIGAYTGPSVLSAPPPPLRQ